MSDVSNFIRRSGNADRDEINKILSIINPLVFPEAENAALKERIIYSNHKRKRTNTSANGLDITTTSTTSRNRYSSAITIIPDSATPTVQPFSATLVGTLTFPSSKKYGAGATFTGTQYYTMTDVGLDLSSGSFGMAIWYKGDGVHQGEQVIYSKRLGDLIADYCSACTDFDSGDYITLPSAVGAGLTISMVGNTAEDYCSACTDFDSIDFNFAASNSGIKVIMADGSNSLEQSITSATDIFDGNWHSIIINSTDIASDYLTGDYHATQFSVTISPQIEVYIDGVSIGTASTSAITGSLANSEIAYFGGTDNGGTIEDLLNGSVALWEYQSNVFNGTAISDYHNNARIRQNGQLAALHFTGNATEIDNLDNLI